VILFSNETLTLHVLYHTILCRVFVYICVALRQSFAMLSEGKTAIAETQQKLAVGDANFLLSFSKLLFTIIFF
jgi:hypothetical protein